MNDIDGVRLWESNIFVSSGITYEEFLSDFDDMVEVFNNMCNHLRSKYPLFPERRITIHYAVEWGLFRRVYMAFKLVRALGKLGQRVTFTFTRRVRP